MIKYANKIGQLPKNITEKVLKLSYGSTNMLSLASGTPTFKIPGNILNNVFKNASNNFKLCQYTPSSSGLEELKEAIAKDLSKEFHKKVITDEILITSGSTAAIFTALTCFADHRDKVIVTSPHWSLYLDQCIILGAKPVNFVLDEKKGWQIDSQKLESLIIKRQAKAVIIANPNNPTGTILSSEPVRHKKLLRMIKKSQAIFIVDETYRNIIEKGLSFTSMADSNCKNIVLCRSFSKDFSMSGFRLGYIYADKEIIKKLHSVHTAINLSCPTFSQYLALEIFKHKDKFLADNSNYYNELRERVCKHLDSLNQHFEYVKPQAGYFVFPKYHQKINSINFFKLLMKAGVAVRPGVGFGKGGENHIRISFTGDFKTIDSAFERIKNALDCKGV